MVEYNAQNNELFQKKNHSDDLVSYFGLNERGIDHISKLGLDIEFKERKSEKTTFQVYARDIARTHFFVFINYDKVKGRRFYIVVRDVKENFSFKNDKANPSLSTIKILAYKKFKLKEDLKEFLNTLELIE